MNQLFAFDLFAKLPCIIKKGFFQSYLELLKKFSFTFIFGILPQFFEIILGSQIGWYFSKTPY